VLVPDADIRSTVSKAVVTLEGRVQFWSERYDAERAVERRAGAKAVVNHVEVKPSVEMNTIDVDLAIQSALERHADRLAHNIDVPANDGVVEVTGVVHTWSERDAVLGAVQPLALFCARVSTKATRAASVAFFSASGTRATPSLVSSTTARIRRRLSLPAAGALK
jgi:hypothetical protein